MADLLRCEILSGAGRADLESLATLLTPFAAPAGTVLLRRGSIADDFLLITAGTALVAFGRQEAGKVAVVTDTPILGRWRCSAGAGARQP